MSINTAYEFLFSFSFIILAFLAGILMFRSFRSRLICDRLLCVNMISNIVVSLIVLLCAKKHDSGIADIALIYVLISFMAVVIFAKVYIPSGDNNEHEEDKNDRVD